MPVVTNPASTLPKQHSPWIEHELPRFPALETDIEVDVAVVGAGVTGITTAYLLRKAGVKVALIDRARVASTDTARTTAHLTYVTDQRLHELAKHWGKDAARTFWEGGAAAVDQIWSLVQETQADCDFRWVPGYLHEPTRQGAHADREKLEQDAHLAVELGFDAELVERVPHANRCGVRFPHQARFHPRKYLGALLRAIPGDGSHVFENTTFEEVDERTTAVRANGRTIRCNYLVVATHNPLAAGKGFLSATLFQTKLSLYTSYVLGAHLPPRAAPEALFWDTDHPYEYLRVDHRGDHEYAILGGEDVKTGQEENAEEVFRKLHRRLEERLPGGTVVHRWLGQVIETADGLPYIGESAPSQFIATGFSGNGWTLGTLAAMLARDRYLKRRNPWFDLLRVDRRPFHGGLWRYVSENVDYPYYFLRDRVAGADEGTFEEIARGAGRLLKWQGKKVAAYRGEDGALTVLSPVCTHLKCLVRWNSAGKTWDCPCHGSRFHPDGRVLSGPAGAPLEKLQAPER
jgi:glycine/D-amino acid oxidase-like deaminating enzyme/nitrite reductase/ring-hydroxylating ferredoxin subunit